ncbi:MAG: hypothetical protein QOD87_1661 [Pseudonocardiales bacterium]|nr:hypothetical protein [Pseudonocardiales bacterium]
MTASTATTPTATTVIADADRATSDSGARSARVRSYAFPLSVVLVVITALVQNLFRLSAASAYADEGAYATAAWRYLHGQVEAVPTGVVDVLPDNFQHPPLAKLLFGVAQVVAGHPSITADRWVAAICSLATGLVLAGWIGSVAGRWAGLLAGAMTVLIPAGTVGTRFGRFGMLDPVAEFFMVSSVALAWWWFSKVGRRAWLLSVAAGVATGLATASKENGFLGICGPIMLGLLLDLRHREYRLQRLGQTLTAVVACGVAFAACYLPFDEPLGRMKFALVFQGTHSSDGHLIGFAGQVAQYPPWWANLWFAGHGLGSWITAGLVSAVLAALALRHRDPLVWWCVAAVAVPLDFHCFIANVTLSFYWVMWMPAVFALAALGIQSLAGARQRLRAEDSVQPAHAAKRFRQVRFGLGAAVATTILLILLGDALAGTWRVITLRPAGPQVLSAVLKSHALSGEVVAAGVYPDEFSPYTAALRMNYGLPETVDAVDAVVIGQPRCRTLVDPAVRALVTVNVKQGRLSEIYSDHEIRLFAASGRLIRPSASEVAQEDPGKLSDQC